MVYVDENGKRLDDVDLNAGYLIDHKWVDHPAQQQQGHYDYARNASGGVVQTFVVDTPARGAWREVTEQMFIPYEKTVEMARHVNANAVDAYVLKGV